MLSSVAPRLWPWVRLNWQNRSCVKGPRWQELQEDWNCHCAPTCSCSKLKASGRDLRMWFSTYLYPWCCHEKPPLLHQNVISSFCDLAIIHFLQLFYLWAFSGNSDWNMGGSWGVGGAIRHDIKISYHLSLNNWWYIEVQVVRASENLSISKKAFVSGLRLRKTLNTWKAS